MSQRKRPSLFKRIVTRIAHHMGGAQSTHTKVWTSQDGRQTMICHLEDRHLCNILRLLQRRRHGTIAMLALDRHMGPPPNGDMARMAWEQEMDNIFEEPPYVPYHPLYQALRDEAEWRGLEW